MSHRDQLDAILASRGRAPRRSMKTAALPMVFASSSHLWGYVARWAKGRGHWAERHEDLTQRGRADVFVGMGLAGHFWLELKVEPDTWKPGQLAWAMDATAHGETCLGLFAHPDGDLVLWNAGHVGAAVLQGQKALPLLLADTLGDALDFAAGYAAS